MQKHWQSEVTFPGGEQYVSKEEALSMMQKAAEMGMLGETLAKLELSRRDEWFIDTLERRMDAFRPAATEFAKATVSTCEAMIAAVKLRRFQ